MSRGAVRYDAAWVLPITSMPIRDGSVVVDGGSITYVGARNTAPTATVHDLGDVMLLPGLVNTHTHLELTAMRGFLEGLPFVDWIRTLTRARAAVLTPDRLLDSARIGIEEGLAAGITTYADTCSSGVVLEAMVEAGVRGIMYQEVFGPGPDQRVTSFDGLRAAVERLRPLTTSLVRLGVSPHAVYSVHEDLLIDVCAWALGEGLPIAMHLSESREEIEFLREGEGAFADMLRARGVTVERRAHSPVHLLVELGVMIARPLLIHCVQLDASDIGFLAEHRCPVAHCPISNAKLAHGVAPILELLEAGVVVGLGSDSVVSSNRMDILDEARMAVLAQRSRSGRPNSLSGAHVLRMATLGGAEALGLEAEIGSLEVGKRADLAAFAIGGPRGTALFDPADALVFGLGSSCATFVCVDGIPLVREARVCTQRSAAAQNVREAARALERWRGHEHAKVTA